LTEAHSELQTTSSIRDLDKEKREMGASTVADKAIVITGASSGIGEATARMLARQEARLVAGARRVERLAALVADFRSPE
jgi:NADPH:quinone reductase-like Zn-dependent oxidoreductase